jgi:hypothetical protein
LPNGESRFSYYDQGAALLSERTLQRYARLGAGIIESGSNANGRYIKYSDGTMECWGVESSTEDTTTNVKTITATFPVAFIAAPHVSYSLRQSSTSTYSSSLVISAITTTTATLTFKLDIAISRTWHRHWHSIGRWRT